MQDSFATLNAGLHHFEIAVSTLSSGIYTLQITDVPGNTINRSFIKSK